MKERTINWLDVARPVIAARSPHRLDSMPAAATLFIGRLWTAEANEAAESIQNFGRCIAVAASYSEIELRALLAAQIVYENRGSVPISIKAKWRP